MKLQNEIERFKTDFETFTETQERFDSKNRGQIQTLVECKQRLDRLDENARTCRACLQQDHECIKTLIEASKLQTIRADEHVEKVDEMKTQLQNITDILSETLYKGWEERETDRCSHLKLSNEISEIKKDAQRRHDNSKHSIKIQEQKVNDLRKQTTELLRAFTDQTNYINMGIINPIEDQRYEIKLLKQEMAEIKRDNEEQTRENEDLKGENSKIRRVLKDHRNDVKKHKLEHVEIKRANKELTQENKDHKEENKEILRAIENQRYDIKMLKREKAEIKRANEKQTRVNDELKRENRAILSALKIKETILRCLNWKIRANREIQRALNDQKNDIEMLKLDKKLGIKRVNEELTRVNEDLKGENKEIRTTLKDKINDIAMPKLEMIELKRAHKEQTRENENLREQQNREI